MENINVYGKLSNARLKLQNTPLNKSGKNTHLNFSYMELQDFLPTINVINDEQKIIALFTTTVEGMKLTIVDIEKPEDKIIFESTTAIAKLSGNASPIQQLGAEHTYMRRYLYMEAYEIVENDILDPNSGKGEGITVKQALEHDFKGKGGIMVKGKDMQDSSLEWYATAKSKSAPYAKVLLANKEG